MSRSATEKHSQFARRLKALRLASGYSHAREFAEAIGLQQNTYTRYERGEAEPNIATLDRMWIALRQPYNQLLGEPPEPPRGTLGGFAEPATRMPAPPPPASSQSTAKNAGVDAMAWQLARLSVDVDADTGPAQRTPSDRLGRLQRINSLCQRLISDPILTTSGLLDRAARLPIGPPRDRLARAIEEFMDTATGTASNARA